MKQQGEHGEANNNEIYSDLELAQVPEEKTKPERDIMTVSDDYNDYKFLKSKKAHHSNNGHRKRHKRRRMKTWKKVLIIIGSVLLSLVLLVAGTVVFMVNKGKGDLIEPAPEIVAPKEVDAEIQDDGMYIKYNGATYKYNENVTNILFMGIDKRDLDGENEDGTGGQSDVNVMIALNLDSHKMTMIAIPRDTMTDVALYTPSGNYNGVEHMQVCMAYAYGDGKETSCDNMVDSVKKIFYNIPVKTYYALDIDGVSAINDAVGGIDVVSPETIEAFTEGESYHLLGRQAERFIKARDTVNVDGNKKRMERHKVYANSFVKTVLSQTKKDISTPVTLFNESAPYSCTNLSPSKVAYLGEQLVFGGGMDTEIVSIPGETKLSQESGLTEFTIDEKGFFEQFLSVYYEKM